MNTTAIFRGLSVDDAILVTLTAADEPVFPWFLLQELRANGFESTSSNWRGLICNHLQRLERLGLVSRHQKGWKITRKGKLTPCGG